MSEPLYPYDLGVPEPPGGFKNLVPRTAPLGSPPPLPYYVPGPQPEGTVRVVLDNASYEDPATADLYEPGLHRLVQPHRVFDVPAEQYERWQAAAAAFDAMQEDIESVISARAQESRG
jgi:hypothetical protein